MMLTTNDVERLLKEAVLRHLSDDELGAYHDSAIDEDTRARVEAHLDLCLICERRLAMMQETLAAYPQEPVTDEDIALIEDLLHREPKEKVTREVIGWLSTFVNWWQQRGIPVASVGAYAAGERAQPQDGQTEDGALRWRVVEDEWGNLIIRFGSHRLELEELRFLLKIGDVEKTAVLERKTEDQVGAEVTLTRDERARIPEDAVLTVDVLNEN